MKRKAKSISPSCYTWKGISSFLSDVVRLLGLAVCIHGMASCSNMDEYGFKDSADALDSYHRYLHSVMQIKSANTTDFCKELKRWTSYTDTVYHVLSKDSLFLKEVDLASRFTDLHDSIRKEMVRLTETWRYSYSDVFKIKRETSSYSSDRELQAAVKEAEPFFLSIDSLPVLAVDKKDLLVRYRHLLAETRAKGFSSKDDMLSYIRLEDVMFRSFLALLYEMDNEPVSDITRETEAICRAIYKAASDKRISAKEAVVYMTMRTVRRLVLNSSACVEDINRKDMKSKAQGNAYLWMIIQPFIGIDEFSIATLTPNDLSCLNYVINQLPKSVRFAKAFGIDQRSLSYLLPQQLLKIYVSSL